MSGHQFDEGGNALCGNAAQLVIGDCPACERVEGELLIADYKQRARLFDLSDAEMFEILGIHAWPELVRQVITKSAQASGPRA